MRRLFFALFIGIITFNVGNASDSLKNYLQAKEQVTTPILEWVVPYNDSIGVKPSYLFMPLIFEKAELINDSVGYKPYNPTKAKELKLDLQDKWLKESMRKQHDIRYIRYMTMIKNPQIVKYNLKDLPEPPKEYFIASDPSKTTLSLEERRYERIIDSPIGDGLRMKKWINTINGSIQFSQAYMSDNWYQGGNNNLNVLGNFNWNLKLNQNLYPKILFENNIQYKVSLNSAPNDTLRNYSISEDLFQMNTKFGYKAYHNWYYSTTLQFKTQFFNNYTVNTNNLKTSFLTPAEINLGIGMSYSAKSKGNSVQFNMSLSPLSLNMKYCRQNDRVDPTSFGIDAGKQIHTEVGSNLEMKFTWKISYNITWTTRLFAFTDYDYVQGDWQNTFNFSINKYLSTQLFAHLRYDDSRAITNESWRYWQFKEILSFGLNYQFSL